MTVTYETLTVVDGAHTWRLTVPRFTVPSDLTGVEVTAQVVASTDPSGLVDIGVYSFLGADHTIITGPYGAGGDAKWFYTPKNMSVPGTPSLIYGLEIRINSGSTIVYIPEDLPNFSDAPSGTDLWLPIQVDASVDSIPFSRETESDQDVTGVDLDGDGEPDYTVVKTPKVAGDPGSGYDVDIKDPDGNVVAVGDLPPGTDPNSPLTIRVNGRVITVLSGGQVVVTYLIPEAHYNLNPSTFWIGYVDSEGHMTGDPLPLTTPPLNGWRYLIDTAFTERPLGHDPRLWLYAPNQYSEAIWEDQDGTIRSSRLPDMLVVDQARWSVYHGYAVECDYSLAVRVWEAGLSRFLSPVP